MIPQQKQFRLHGRTAKTPLKGRLCWAHAAGDARHCSNLPEPSWGRLAAAMYLPCPAEPLCREGKGPDPFWPRGQRLGWLCPGTKSSSASEQPGCPLCCKFLLSSMSAEADVSNLSLKTNNLIPQICSSGGWGGALPLKADLKIV